MDAINKQEIAKKELDGVTRQQEQLQGEIDALVKDSGRLTELCKEQDELLGELIARNDNPNQIYKHYTNSSIFH